MAQSSTQQLRVFALFLVLASVFSTGFAQQGGSGTSSPNSRVNFEKLSTLKLERVGVFNLTAVWIDVYRYAAVIPTEVATQIGKTPFTAVFEVMTKNDRFHGCRPLPRTLLIQKGAWFESRGDSLRVLRAAMQLPQDKGDEPARVVIDVECAGDYVERVDMKYSDYTPEVFSKEQLFYKLHRRTYLYTLGLVDTFDAQRSSNHKLTSAEFTCNKKDLCTNPHGVVLGLLETKFPLGTRLHWMSNSSSSATTEAVLLEPTYNERGAVFPVVAYVPFRPDQEGRYICDHESNTTVVLRASCEQCSLESFYGARPIWLNSEPPQDSTLVYQARIRGFWDSRARFCNVDLKSSVHYFNQIRTLGAKAVLDLHYQPSEACEPLNSALAPQSPYWARERQVRALLEFAKNPASVHRSFFMEECACKGLRGHVYRQLGWAPLDEKVDEKSNTEEPEEPEEPEKRVKERKSFLPFQQKLTAGFFYSSTTLAANITAHELRCATENVTATFVLTGDYPISTVYSVASPYTLRQSAPLWNERTQTVEVVLKPLVTAAEQAACFASNVSEALPLGISCSGCSKVEATVRFTSGPPIASLPSTSLALMPSRGAMEGILSTWRLAAVVHADVLVRGAGAMFTAVLKVRSLKNANGIKHFTVRPRSLLASEGAWYTQEEVDGGKYVVHAAMQLPQNWKDGSEPPKVIVDVECDNCDPKNVELLYEPGFSLNFIRKANVYHSVSTRGLSYKTFHISQSDSFSSVSDQFEYIAEFKKEDLCSAPFGVVIQIDLSQNSGREPVFFWEERSSRIGRPHEAEVGVSSDSLIRYVRLTPNGEEHVFCSDDSVTEFVLKILSNRERAVSAIARVWLPRQPQIPQGASVETVADLTTTLQKDGHCTFNIEEEDKALEVVALGNGAVFRLWRSSSLSCAEPVGSAIRDLEAQLANRTVTVGQRFRATQCVCDGLQGRVYRLLDWDFAYEHKNYVNASPRFSGLVYKDELTVKAASVALALLPNRVSGEVREDRVVFDNWVSEEDLKAEEPFITMFCFFPESGSNTGTIESVSLGEKVPLTPFTTDDSDLQCYAFDSCDAWQANSVPLPQIVVMGSNVSKSLRWRLDKAISFANTSVDGFYASRGGWYGTPEQQRRFRILMPLITFKVVQTSPPQCVHSRTGIRASTNAGDTMKSASSSAEVFVRPLYQLFPSQTLSLSGDWGSLRVNAFISSFIILILCYQHSCC